MEIKLTTAQLNKCIKFSEICANQQQEIEFGQSDTKPRLKKEITRDNLIGKIAEVAFQVFLQSQYNLSVELDFNYYPRGKWDGEDVIINGWKFDIKGTRQGGKWMLIEWSKLNFRQKDCDLPHIFVMFSVHWDRSADKPTGTVTLVGYISTNRLIHTEPKVTVLRKGELLPNTKNLTPLQADNFGIPFNKLYTNWDWLVERITSNSPFSLDNYPNPYTAEANIDKSDQ